LRQPKIQLALAARLADRDPAVAWTALRVLREGGGTRP
jgi:hypothetical protein